MATISTRLGLGRVDLSRIDRALRGSVFSGKQQLVDAGPSARQPSSLQVRWSHLEQG